MVVGLTVFIAWVNSGNLSHPVEYGTYLKPEKNSFLKRVTRTWLILMDTLIPRGMGAHQSVQFCKTLWAYECTEWVFIPRAQ